MDKESGKSKETSYVEESEETSSYEDGEETSSYEESEEDSSYEESEETSSSEKSEETSSSEERPCPKSLIIAFGVSPPSLRCELSHGLLLPVANRKRPGISQNSAAEP